MEVSPATETSAVASTSQTIAAPTTSGAEQVPSQEKRDQNVVPIVVGVLVGLGVLVGGLVLFLLRRRLRTDGKRSSKPYLNLDGGDRIGMLETSIARARYGGVEPSVLPLGGQAPTILPMDDAVLRQSSRGPHQARPPDLTLPESRSPTRTETPGLTSTNSHDKNRRQKKGRLIMFSKTALPPYPGSPRTGQ